MRHDRFWHGIRIRRIEDLANALFGADLEAVQLAGPELSGSLAFAESDGVVFSTGLIHGNAEVVGPLAADVVTIVLGLRCDSFARFWLHESRDGEICVLLPSARYDAIHSTESLYMAASLPITRLRALAKHRGFNVNALLATGTGLHALPLAAQPLNRLRHATLRVHAGRDVEDGRLQDVGFAVLHAVIEHCARLAFDCECQVAPRGHAAWVHRARQYIRTHLDGPITLDALAFAAGTSRRSLARAFHAILRETPASYVRRLRLHRIRRDLASGRDPHRTIASVAARWGMGEAGRMAIRYRSLFGEHPAETRARCLSDVGATQWL